MDILRQYYSALKPERTYANVMTTAAGFLFACKWHVHWGLLLATILGTTFVVMAACAANNCTDRELDARMPRTKKRPTVLGTVPIRNLIVVAFVLGALGFGLLALYVNLLTVIVGIIGFVDYAILYAWAKRTTPWSTLVGTISGAAPMVAGYTAATGTFDLSALLLGLVMVLWQMPHFFAIGIFRKEDYAAGKLPIWPVRYGVRNTQRWMIAYVWLFLLAIALLVRFGSTGITFTLIVGAMGLYWLFLALKGVRLERPEKWARGMFGFSLILLIVFSGALIVAPILP